MITKLLNEINTEIKELNHLLEDKQYLKDLEKRIEDINNRIDRKNKENKQLHSIIKEVREYIYKNSFDEERKEIIDELWVNEIKDILKILDKENE